MNYHNLASRHYTLTKQIGYLEKQIARGDDDLMEKLEDKGYSWRDGEKPTEAKCNVFALYDDGICIYLDDNKISYGGYSTFCKFNEYYSKDYELIKYPSKGYGLIEYPASSDYAGKQWTGKLELSYVPSQIIRDIAEVRMYGNDKYKDPKNWQVVPTKQWVDALYRHLLEFIDNPKSVDSESGIPHYKHMACNLAFICELMKEKEVKNESQDNSNRR